MGKCRTCVELHCPPRGLLRMASSLLFTAQVGEQIGNPLDDRKLPGAQSIRFSSEFVKKKKKQNLARWFRQPTPESFPRGMIPSRVAPKYSSGGSRCLEPSELPTTMECCSSRFLSSQLQGQHIQSAEPVQSTALPHCSAGSFMSLT